MRKEERDRFMTILKFPRRSASFSISRGSLGLSFLLLLPLPTSALPLTNLADIKNGAGKRAPMQYPKARQPAPTKMALSQLKSIVLSHSTQATATVKQAILKSSYPPKSTYIQTCTTKQNQNTILHRLANYYHIHHALNQRYSFQEKSFDKLRDGVVKGPVV